MFVDKFFFSKVCTNFYILKINKQIIRLTIGRNKITDECVNKIEISNDDNRNCTNLVKLAFTFPLNQFEQSIVLGVGASNFMCKNATDLSRVHIRSHRQRSGVQGSMQFIWH